MSLDRWLARKKAKESAESPGRPIMPSGVSFWRPKEGRNVIRVFRFKHIVCDIDISKLGRYSTDEVRIGEEVYEFCTTYRDHFPPGGGPPVPCGRYTRPLDGQVIGECMACLETEAVDKNTRADQRPSVRRGARVTYPLTVVDRTTPPGEDQSYLMWQSPRTFCDWLITTEQEMHPDTLFGEEGRDIVVRYNPQKNAVKRNPQMYYLMSLLASEDRGRYGVTAPLAVTGDPPDMYSDPEYLPVSMRELIPTPEPKPVPVPEPEPVPVKKKTRKKKAKTKTKNAEQWVRFDNPEAEGWVYGILSEPSDEGTFTITDIEGVAWEDAEEGEFERVSGPPAGANK